MLFHRLGDRVICAIWGVSLLCITCFSSPLLLFNTVHLLLFCLPLCLFLVTPFHWWRSGCSKLAVDLCCLWLLKGSQGTIFKGSNFQKCWAGLTGLQCYGKCPASLNMRLLPNVFSKRPKSTSPRLVNSFGKLSLAFLTLDEFFCLSHLINRFLAFCFPIFLRFITYVFVFLCCDLFLLSILLTITAHHLCMSCQFFLYYYWQSPVLMCWGHFCA